MRMPAIRSLSGVSRVKSKKLRTNGIAIARLIIPMITARRIVRSKVSGLEIEKTRRKSMAKVTIAEVVISSERV